MKKILVLLALCASSAWAQQDLCDFTGEADAADIDGFELLMGDPLNSCEGYSVTFANFQAALAPPSLDFDGDGTKEVYGATVSTHPSVCLSPGDAGVCQARLSNYSGGAFYSPFFLGGGMFLGTTADLAESHWWLRPVSATRLLVTNMTHSTTVEFGHDGTRPYFDIYGSRYYGGLATAPACSADGSVYTDTDDGSGNAAHCVCLDGAWAKTVGAGACA